MIYDPFFWFAWGAILVLIWVLVDSHDDFWPKTS